MRGTGKGALKILGNFCGRRQPGSYKRIFISGTGGGGLGARATTPTVSRSERQPGDREKTLSDYVDDDGTLTPKGEINYLRFLAGAKTVEELLNAAGPDWLIEGWLATSATMVTGSLRVRVS